jgi:lactobin A/cerein 7B family class IIb bacteriocin
MQTEIRSLTEHEVEGVSGGVIPAWLVALGWAIVGNAVYDALKDGGVFKPIDWQAGPR